MGLLAVAAFAQVAGAHPLVTEGRRLYEELEYRRAVKVLAEAARVADLSRDEQIEALRLLGLCQATLSDLAGAAATFKRLLEIDPSFTFERSTTPRILDLFDKVKSTMPRREAPPPVLRETEIALAHVAPASAHPGRTLELAVTVSDPERRAARIVVRYRASGAGGWSEVGAAVTGRSAVAQLPGIFVVVPGVEYYIAALDGSGRVLTSAGSEEQPIAVPVREEPRVSAPVYRRWWFWTIAGVVLAGGVAGGVGAGVASRRGGPTSGASDVTITLTP